MTTGTTSPSAEEPPPLRSVHTSNFPDLLRQLGGSLLLTTYQAGRLVVLRADGGVLNTHFRGFPQPMGLAQADGRLAIGTRCEIREFRDLPAVAAKLDPPGRHDACFLPRRANVTGDVQIHELAWIGDEVWFVNTAFSCLATRSDDFSFEPRWRPPFISALELGDRCHLNGLAVRDGAVRWVTALGESDVPGGWRERKRDGGVLIDVPSGEVVCRGLSMPHSPRWHDGRLWVLNSGEGGLGTVDLATGRYEEVVQLPGFTRGLAFVGRFAFVGLSQVRETAVFSGIPLVDRLKERSCGVWAVDIRTGEAFAFVRFEDALQEVFAVEFLPGLRFPDVIDDDLDLVASSFELPGDPIPTALSETASVRSGVCSQ